MPEFVAKMTSQGRATIPAAVRRHLGIDGPGPIAFVIDDGGKVAVRRPRFRLEAVFGSVPTLPGRETVDFDDLIEEAMELEAEQVVRGMGGL